MLLLPGDTFAVRQPDPVLQQLEQEYCPSVTTNDAFRPVCKFWDRITRPEQLMSTLVQAMRVLTDPADTGAVCAEMEGASIANTAYRNGVPFVIIRAISDKADNSAEMDYPTFEALAAERCAQVTMKLAEMLK